MAVDGYMYFVPYVGNPLASESQVDTTTHPTSEPLFTQFNFGTMATGKNLFEIEDFSFDIEQTLNIGSQSTGAGAGKVTFNPFSINRKIDISSPTLFQMACSGTPFKQVTLWLRKSSGGQTSGQIFLVFNFKLVAVKTIAWSYDDESPKEAMTFEYGGLQVFYSQQKPDGSMLTPIPSGWNRVKNIQDDQPTSNLIQ